MNRNKTIVIDAGHGGKDPGATNRAHKEKDIVLDYSIELKERLVREGYKVVLTRDKDVFLELKERADIRDNNNADIFVSIHCNSFSSNKVQGIEIFTIYDKYKHYKESFRLAENIYNKIIEDKNNYTKERGIKQAGFRVLKTKENKLIPSVLLEIGFISNEKDKEIMLNRKEEITEKIKEGIMKYFGHVKKKDNKIKIIMEDKVIVDNVILRNNKSYVPVRDVLEALDYKVDWSKEDRNIYIDKNIGKTIIEKDKEEIEVNSINNNGTIYFGIRDFYEKSGYSVLWDNINKKIIIKGDE